MHLVLEQALERDTVPLPARQRGQDGDSALGASRGRCLPRLAPWWCGAGPGGQLAGQELHWVSQLKPVGYPLAGSKERAPQEGEVGFLDGV